jgi:uncharacterized protein (TIGR00369 family)
MTTTAPAPAPGAAAAAEPSAAPDEVLQHALDTVFAPYVQQLGLQLLHAQAGLVELALPVLPLHVHAGGVLCGQSMMAACDSAMVLAVITRLGSFKPMTTVQLQTSFLRPVPGDSGRVRVRARVLRMGRNLVFGEVELLDARDQLAAHATTTYALL